MAMYVNRRPHKQSSSFVCLFVINVFSMNSEPEKSGIVTNVGNNKHCEEDNHYPNFD